MSEKRDRAPRKEVHAPTIVHSGEPAYDVELRDIFDTGAVIEFQFCRSSQTSFYICHLVELGVTENNR